MAPQSTKEPGPASNGPVAAAVATTPAGPDAKKDDPIPIGPQSGLSFIPTQYIQEQSIRQMLTSIGYNETQEDQYRLKGVQLIDSVRKNLQLYVSNSSSPTRDL